MTEEVKLSRDELILKAKELYSKGSRNYLLKCYSESADELSEVCALYEEIYGELSDELGMPYLLYAKSLIALALEENKVIDVPDEEDEEDDEDEIDEDTTENNEVSADKNENSNKKNTESDETKEPDSTENKIEQKPDSTIESTKEKKLVENDVATSSTKTVGDVESNGAEPADGIIKPSTSNGKTDTVEEEEENEAASSLQLAWEILELAAKIFTRQGLNGLPNLAEVQTELANIEFENNILDSAREDYEKALKIYKNLTDKYRRAMAEIHYKIGLTYLMQQMNQEGAESLKNACALIEDEINELKAKEDLVDKNTEIIKDMEETKQEIWAKIAEIEETRQQNIAEVRAALDSYIGPSKGKPTDSAGPSSSGASSSVTTSSSKPKDITHLIKRKKPDTDPPNSESEAVAASPAKRAAV
ncbi:protein NASP homolog [Episyrphus balteatus]|uniref:protein NASP homolog n=1 Tax=Episyrphus balteatus TaxID=286459 RepID=UPI002484E857|nr:protein NASP homolog [Episyrphus balteatus]